MSKIIMTCPAARAGWTCLHTLNTKFDAEGTYETTLWLNPSNSQAKVYLKDLEKHYKDFLKETKDNGIKVRRAWELQIDEEGDSTDVGVKFKQKNKDWMKGKNPIAFFDSRGNPLTGKIPNIGKGSILIITSELVFNIVSGKAYMTLRPKAVQILELEVYTVENCTAEEYGFHVHEGAYEASNEDVGYLEDEELDAVFDEDEEEAA